MIGLDSSEGVMILGCVDREDASCGEPSNARRRIDEGTRASCAKGREWRKDRRNTEYSESGMWAGINWLVDWFTGENGWMGANELKRDDSGWQWIEWTSAGVRVISHWDVVQRVRSMWFAPAVDELWQNYGFQKRKLFKFAWNDSYRIGEKIIQEIHAV